MKLTYIYAIETN